MDGLPLFEADIDRIGTWIALIKPADTQPALRRQALTHTLLERAVLASRYAAEREATRSTALELLARLATDPTAPEGIESGTVSGTWDDLGLVVWGETRELETDSWSGPFEDAGRWLLLRRTDHTPGIAPGADLYQVELISLPFVPSDFSRADVEATIDDALLTVIDPAFGDLVPAHWRLRMNGPE
ncbi:MAG: hypothetical protein P1V81_17545 [Planctomycetota bacterium]|nr:hypothetical protein [Planctomycetota bacterium]